MDKGNRKGFTLIELMIAMVVLAFGILGFTFLNSQAINNRTFSRDLNRATIIAGRLAENLMYLEYDDPLLTDTNTEDPAVVTKYPTASDSNGDTGTIAGMSYIITTSALQGTIPSAKWYTVQLGNQRYHLRWEVLTGNSTVAAFPGDKVKLLRIFSAFEKKDPQQGIILGGYFPARIGPTILTFKMDKA
ncbi:MAG: prepilin-type N-terminal cleavage/methylation domain-containing protein [Deltaproteobacteria bacterium]|nr:prepilin-type N-terminal cleavage/methylation domain-containing protein [Deltaproteobacteria bacterium]